MDVHIKDQLCNEWCDLLSQYTLAEVRAGVADVFAASGGRLKAINEFQVQEQIRATHAQIVAQLPKQEEAPDRKPVDGETANDIMAQFGFAPKRMPTGDA